MTDTATSPFTGGIVGEARLRKEDAALLTGESRFLDDLDLPGALWLACVRSPHPPARLGDLDASAPLATAGVGAVYTAPALAEYWAGPLPSPSPPAPAPCSPISFFHWWTSDQVVFRLPAEMLRLIQPHCIPPTDQDRQIYQ